MNKINRWITVLGIAIYGVLLAGLPFSAIMADEASEEEQKLEQEAKNMDNQASAKSESALAKSLAQQYGIAEARITEMRNQNMGWGNITNSLAMAGHYASIAHPPITADESLTKILQLRSEGMGWGKIAQELGFKLGPVVSAAHRSAKSLKASSTSKGKGSASKPSKANRIEKPQRSLEKRQKPEHTGKPDHPGHSGKGR